MPSVDYPHIAVDYPHIVPDAYGVLRIEGAGYKAIVLLESTLARGLSIEEMLEAWDLLTPASAHALMAFYHDNRAELDEIMRQREAEDAAFRARPDVQAWQDEMRRKLEEWQRRDA